ncbi:MAG: amino acid adenylation domain-containing protein, partial [Bacteroidota bacterium]
DAYRSVLQKDAAGVEIVFVEPHQSDLQWMDFSEANQPEWAANTFMQDEFVRPFDLFAGQLLHRFVLVKVDDEFHYLFSVYHHIITDGWGTSLMFQRLVNHYNEILQHGAVQTTYPFSYGAFVNDDWNYQTSEQFEKDKNYWLHRFAILPENLLDKRFESLQLNKSHRQVLYLNRQWYNELNDLAKNWRVSTFHLILAALYLYFAKRQQKNDLAIGLPVLNRGKRSFKQTVGLFMGLAPLRIQLDMDGTFKGLVQQVKQQLRQDYRHQRYPLGRMIQDLQIFKEKERLFNLTLSYEKQDYAHHFQATQTRVIPMSHHAERVALAIYIREFDEREDVKIDFDYNLNYFDAISIQAIVGHFDQLLKACCQDPEQTLSTYTFLKAEEHQKIVNDFNQTQIDFGEADHFIQLFQQQANRLPHQIATKDRTSVFSYRDLDALSDKIAKYIQSIQSTEHASPIAVLMDRSAHLLAVLLGIMKSGHPYLPLDPAFPKDRLAYILEHSHSKCLISDRAAEDLLGNLTEVKVLLLDDLLIQCKQLAGQAAIQLSKTDTAYIIYTSGSTGKPKGVEIQHAALLNFLQSMLQQPGLCSTDLLFSVTTYSFDISILEFFTPLIAGATVYMADPATLSHPQELIQVLRAVQPTILQATPSFYQMLYHAGWEGNQQLKVLCGGDLLSEALAEKLLEDHLEVWNMYGPTETTIWSSIKRLTNAQEASNIGRPIHNTSFYILDEHGQVMPIGANGALYIGGAGLAKGYYRDPKLTQNCFIPHPLDSQQRLYKTGDLGRWTRAGEVVFLGRNDLQVKIRGYRIELGDIESHLNQLEGIQAAVLVAKRGAQQDAFLVAYVVLADLTLTPNQIIRQLSGQLPTYMIPQVIEPLKAFPLTPNQKVDRKQLIERPLGEAQTDSIG